MRVERQRELRRRRKRRNKTRKLKEQLEKASSTEDKARLIAKLRRVNPFLKLS